MPLPHRRAHRLFLLKIKCSIIHLDMVSVYTNLDDFNRPVEGAMKLLRACFRNFQCIFHLANLINCNCFKQNYCGIKVCIWYVLKYFVGFINFVEDVVGLMNFWQWLCHNVADSIFGVLSKFSQEMICTMSCNIIFMQHYTFMKAPILDLSDIPAQFTCL